MKTMAPLHIVNGFRLELCHIAHPAKGQGYRILLYLKIYIPALLNGTHPFHTETGQPIKIICSVFRIAWCTVHYVLVAAIIVKALKWRKKIVTRSIFNQIK